MAQSEIAGGSSKINDVELFLKCTGFFFPHFIIYYPSSFTEIKLTYNSVKVQRNNLTYMYHEMMNMLKFSQHASFHIDTKQKKNVLPVVRILSIYSRNSFHIQLRSVLAMFIMLYIKSLLIYYLFYTYLFYKWKFVPFHCLHPTPPPLPALPLVTTNLISFSNEFVCLFVCEV